MHRRLSYANVVATLALVFAMSGGALAAKHYLINSTNQINPRVLKKLRGATGKTGASGAAGAPGAPGATGKEGPLGKEGSSGKEGPAGKEGQRGPSNGYQVFNDATGPVGEPAKTVATLALPAGSYLVTAKLWVKNTSSERIDLECQLTNDVNDDSDELVVTAEPKGTTTFFGRTAGMLEAASKLDSAGHWLVKCEAFNAPVEIFNVKLQAVQVASLANSATSTS